nr:hypothetical protein [Tanacetum cinerariifolium]
MQKDVRNLVASPFTARIRDYDILDGLKVPTNLKTYDEMSDPDDSIHGNYGRGQAVRTGLVSFLSYYREWGCPILTQAEILRIQQRSDESLRDYLGRFGKETLQMTDHSDAMMTEAFISRLRPWRNGCLSHLANGSKTQNSSLNPISSGATKTWKNQTDWKQKVVAPKAGNKVLMIDEGWSLPHYQENRLQHNIDITFTSDEPVPDHCSGDDSLVIKLDNETKASLRLPTSSLVGFSGQVLWPLRVITAPFTFSDYIGKGSKTITTDFMIVRASSAYNVILGQPGMR